MAFSSKPPQGMARSNEKRQRTLTIFDRPTTDDEFGSHRRVAGGIVELILTEAGGRTIGLEGEWGAGKSTVIELVREELSKKSADFEVFVYNTWSHQGDPLRRSFLEALGNHLVAVSPKPWIQSGEWNTTKESLARRSSRSERTSRPRFTPQGRILVGSLFGVPVGAALFGRGLEVAEAGQIALGALLVVLPLLLAVLMLVAKRSKSQDGEWEDPWALLTKSSFLTETTDTIGTPDPTSIEFAELFDRIVAEALGTVTDRRLLLVLDNLDRVDGDTALQILATLQTFFPQGQAEEVKSRLWVLLPYSSSGLESFWKERHMGDFQSFISKVREVRFEVPPLVLSDWRIFLGKRLQEAFPDRQGEEIALAARVIADARLDHAPNNPAPTPRDLIRVVNLMGSIHRQRQDTPFHHLAYFAWLRDIGLDVGSGLLLGNVPGPRVAFLLGLEASASLAALHFNSEIGNAEQVLLGNPLTRALLDGDTEEIMKLASRHGPAFWRVFESVIHPEWATRSDLAKVGLALGARSQQPGNGLLGQMDFHLRVSLKELLRNVGGDSMNSAQDAIGLVNLIAAVGMSSDEIGHVVTKLATLAPPPQVRPNYLEDQIGALVVLVSELHQRAVWQASADQDSRIVIPGGGEQFLLACEALAKGDPSGRFWGLFAPDAPPEEVAELVEKWPGQEPAAGRSPAVLRVLSSTRSDFDLSGFVDALGDFLRNPAAAGSALAFAVECLEVVRDGSQLLSTLVEEGWVLHHTLDSHERDDYRTAGLLAFQQLELFQKVSEGAQVPEQGSTADGLLLLRRLLESPDELEDLNEQVLNQIVARGSDLPFMLGVAPDGSLWPWARSAISSLAEDHPEMITDRRVVTFWSPIAEALAPGGLDAHLTRLLGAGALVPEMISQGVDRSPDLVIRVLALSGSDQRLIPREERERLIASAATWLQSLDKAKWIEALGGSSPEADLAFALIEHGHSPGLRTPFGEALIDHAGSVASGGRTVADPTRWAALKRMFSADRFREEVARSIISRLSHQLSGGTAVDPLFWTIYGSLLLESKDVRTYEGLLSGIVGDAVRVLDSSTLAWVNQLFDLHAEILSDPQNSTRVKTLRDLVAESAKADQTVPQLNELARQLGVSTRA